MLIPRIEDLQQLAMPNLEFLACDPVHLCIAYEYCHRGRKTAGSKVERQKISMSDTIG